MPHTRPSPPSPPAIVIVAPTFNHAPALAAVLQSLDPLGFPIIVVNDGATDHTPAVLAQWLAGRNLPQPRLVVAHTSNRGKADALRSGFQEAIRLGFTHALTIDTDGQHDAADLPRLVEAARNRPEALVVGARSRNTDSAKPPWPSRVGRAISNRLVWLESGVRVTDSQSGMRVYPLAEMKFLSGHAARYGFETEVLTRAGWRAVPVVQTPIRSVYDPPGGRTTHFGLVRDSLAAAAMHARLLALALLPGHARLADGHEDPGTGSIPSRLAAWFSPRRAWRMARAGEESQERLAASLGVGLLMATLPVYGVKTATCLWLSKRFRLHPLVVIATSSLSTPPFGLVFALLSICVGSLVLRADWPAITLRQLEASGAWHIMRTMLWEWVVGSVIAGTVLGLSGYWGARVMLARPRPPSDLRSAPQHSSLAQPAELEER